MKGLEGVRRVFLATSACSSGQDTRHHCGINQLCLFIAALNLDLHYYNPYLCVQSRRKQEIFDLKCKQ